MPDRLCQQPARQTCLALFQLRAGAVAGHVGSDHTTSLPSTTARNREQGGQVRPPWRRSCVVSRRKVAAFRMAHTWASLLKKA